MCSLTGSAVGPGDAYARVRTEIIDAEAKKKKSKYSNRRDFYVHIHTYMFKVHV